MMLASAPRALRRVCISTGRPSGICPKGAWVIVGFAVAGNVVRPAKTAAVIPQATVASRFVHWCIVVPLHIIFA
jgi:hypothetical protein